MGTRATACKPQDAEDSMLRDEMLSDSVPSDSVPSDSMLRDSLRGDDGVARLTIASSD
jgi:hypothetical protein